MPTFRWYDGSLGAYSYPYMNEYSVTYQSSTLMVFRINSFYDAAYSPYRMVFQISGGRTYQDPETGQTSYTAGQITGINFFNEQGRKITDVTGLSVDAAFAFSILTINGASDPSTLNFWNVVLASNTTGSLFIGSNDTGRDDLPVSMYGFRAFDMGDDIKTTMGNDTVRAGGDSDWIADLGGLDVYDGQAGAMDMVSYSAWRNMTILPQTGIVADLAAGRVKGPDGHVDQLINIEAVYGTAHADVLRGSSVANTLIGGAGADTLDGRGGFDEAFYLWGSGQNSGIRVNIATGTIRDSFGSLDRIISIESVVGTYQNDRFVDSLGAQRFDGDGGNDWFSLSTGNDTVTGGWGADTFKFLGTSFGTDRITDFSTSDGDRLHVTGAASFAGLTITNNASGDRVITIGASKIILEDQAGLVLDAGDFIFG